MTRPQFSKKDAIYDVQGTKGALVYNFGSSDGNGANNSLSTAGFAFQFNGSSWDRKYNNTQGTLLASASRTISSISSPQQTNFNAKGVQVILNITAAPSTPVGIGLSFGILGVDTLSGSAYIVGAYTANKATTGAYVLSVYPAVTGTTGSGASNIITATNQVLPRTWYVYLTNNNSADTFTFSLGYSYIL